MYLSKTKLLSTKQHKWKKMTQTINKEIGFMIQLENKQSKVPRNIEEIISEAVDSSFSLFGETFKDLSIRNCRQNTS